MVEGASGEKDRTSAKNNNINIEQVEEQASTFVRAQRDMPVNRIIPMSESEAKVNDSRERKAILRHLGVRPAVGLGHCSEKKKGRD